jgi:N-formylglutamate amidohydrolase
LQIEINRALYVDEKTLLKRSDFAALSAVLAVFMRQMGDFVTEFCGDSALAAE